MSNQEKSPTESSTRSAHSEAELQEAEDNLTRCLEAYDQNGEQGFLDVLNPSPALKAVGLRRIKTPLGHALVTEESYLKTRKATSSEME